MATGMSATEAAEAVDAWLASYTWVKLHVGDPGAAGTSNAATETTRKQATWTTGAAAASNTGALAWTNVAGTEDYTHFSIWTASTAGTFGGSGTITANPVTAGDNFTIGANDLDIAVTSVAS